MTPAQTATRPMAIVTAPGKVELQERLLPALGAEDVLVDVHAVTLCGSDLHIFRGLHPAAQPPVAVGHEIAGVVAEVGPGVDRVRPGDRVTVEPVIACGNCHYCARGQYHLCVDISFQYRRGQGGLTTQFVANQRWVHRLPASLSPAAGALMEPLSVAVHAMRKSGLTLGESCAIFGAGAIGLMLLSLARHSGAKALVVDIDPFRLQAAASRGAGAVFNNREGDAVAEIIAHTGGLGADRAFEAVGLNLTLEQALRCVRKGGQVVLVGLFEKPQVSLPANLFVQREISLAGSQGYCWDFQTSLALADPGRLELDWMVTHTFPLEQVQRAFEALADPGSQAIKILVKVREGW